MRVLLIAYFYPPSPAVGGFRAEKVARALQRAGHTVRVITARMPGETVAVRVDEPGLVVQTVEPMTSPRWWLIGVKALLTGRPSVNGAGGSAAPSGEDANSEPPPGGVPRWKRWLSALLWLPDDKQGFIPPAVWAGLRRRSGRYDLLYTTVPPFSTHLAGLGLGLLTRRPWVAEFRDPWTDSHFRPAHQRSRWTSAIERWFERRTLRRASLVVSVSEGIAARLRTKLPEAERSKCLVIHNGIDRLAPPRPPRVGRPFRIVHVGSFYHRRDPFPFLEGVAELVRRSGLGPEALSIVFAGNCRAYRGISVEARARSLGLESHLVLHDWIPQSQARQMVEDADLLLLLAQDQPDQIPNKLYDYMGSRIPILAFADKEGESARILRDVGGHYIVTDDRPDRTLAALSAALGLGERPPDPDPGRLETWLTERQMDRLITHMESLMAGAHDGQSR